MTEHKHRAKPQNFRLTDFFLSLALKDLNFAYGINTPAISMHRGKASLSSYLLLQMLILTPVNSLRQNQKGGGEKKKKTLAQTYCTGGNKSSVLHTSINFYRSLTSRKQTCFCSGFLMGFRQRKGHRILQKTLPQMTFLIRSESAVNHRTYFIVHPL